MHYKSATNDVDGKKECDETFELKRPDYAMEAKRVPGKNVFDVVVKSNDPQGNCQTENKQYTRKQLQNQINSNLREHPVGEAFSHLMRPSLPTLPFKK